MAPALTCAQPAPYSARLFQLAAFAVYAYTIYYSTLYVNVPPIQPNYGIFGKAKFLTQWNLCLCGVYFGLCAFLAVRPVRRLLEVRDFIFCSISLPSCIFVSAVFWGLYAIDRELIFPQRIEPHYPNWVNHCSHSLIVLTALAESVLYSHRKPSRSAAIGALLAWFTTYLIWVLYLGLVYEVWVYPVMQVLSPSGLTGFFVCCSIMVLILHLAADVIIELRSTNGGDTSLRGTKKSA